MAHLASAKLGKGACFLQCIRYSGMKVGKTSISPGASIFPLYPRLEIKKRLTSTLASQFLLHSLDGDEVRGCWYHSAIQNYESKENSVISDPKDMGGTISQITSVTQLLEFLKSQTLSPENISLALHRLEDMCTPEEKTAVLEGDWFDQISKDLDQQMTTLSVPVLLNCLRSLLRLSQNDIYIIQSIETQVVWLLKKLSCSQLCRVVECHKDHSTTDLRNNIFKEALLLLEKRWVEISNPKDLVSLMYLSASQSGNFFSKLEERALDLAEQMNAKQLYRILYLLARRKRRNMPLIRALVFHMNRQDLEFSSVHLTNLTYACAILNVYDSNLMNSIAKSIMTKSEEGELFATTLVVSLLKSMRALRWLEPVVLDVLSKQLLKDIDVVDVNALTCLLGVSATLNYLPDALRSEFMHVIDRLSDLRTKDHKAWLDVVYWSTLLQVCTKTMIQSVLEPAFLASLEDCGLSDDGLSELKLHSLDTEARYCMADYTGPLLQDTLLTPNKAQLPHRTKRDLMTCLVDSLSEIAPAERYLRQNVDITGGYTVDVEMLVNANGEPKPIEEAMFSNDHHSLKAVPADFHRLAFKVLTFQDTTIGEVQPLGWHRMAVRHMDYLGYKVVQVPYYEIDMNSKVVERVQYLQRKIKDAINETR